MYDLSQNLDLALENARFILQELCSVQSGASAVFVADGESFGNARVLAMQAKSLGANGIIIDIDHFRDEKGFLQVPQMQPLRQAILHADMAFLVANQKRTNFGRILGNRDETDKSLLKTSRRFTLEANGMDQWRLDRKRIARDRDRTEALFRMLQKSQELRITSPLGTDLTCRVGGAPDGMYPVMNIIPFYGEVAIVPAMGTVNGVFICDGASEFAYHHRGFPIRPNFPGHNELWCKPLALTFRDSVLVSYEGDPVQTQRLDRLMTDIDPKPDLCDEVGLVTATSPENDRFGWLVDGTHQTHCVHVAIGNNRRRGEIIHSKEHVDFDMHRPTVSVDGQVIYSGGEFNDDLVMRY